MRLFFVVLLCLIPYLLIGNSFKNDRSGLWVVRYAVTTKADIDNVLSTAVELNITDIFFQVRALGYSYYNSRCEKKADIVKGDFDPLRYVIKKSASTGIRIHAWVNMFYIWAGDEFPSNKDHIIYRSTDHILRNNGFPDYQNLKKNGHEGFFLDPGAADVQIDLLDILKEIAGSYDLAGIHLDYYRYPSLTFSFSPAGRTRYMLNKFYDPWDIYESSQNYSKKRGYEVFLHADKEYRKSLTTTLSNYLHYISEVAKAIQPDLEISVAVKPDPAEAKHRYFQDWLTWVRDKICDFVVLMNYRTDWLDFESVLKQLSDRNMKERIIVGVSTYNQDVGAVLKRLEATRKEGFTGYSIFSYNHLNKNKDYLHKLRRQIIAWR